MSILLTAGNDGTLSIADFFASSPATPITFCFWVKVSAFYGSGTHTLDALKLDGGTGYINARVVSNGASGRLLQNASYDGIGEGSASVDLAADFVGEWRPCVGVFATTTNKTLYTRNGAGTTLSGTTNYNRYPTGEVDLSILAGTWTGDVRLANFGVYQSALTQLQAEEFFDTGEVAALTPYALWAADSDWGVGDIADTSGNARDITPAGTWSYSSDNPSFAPTEPAINPTGTDTDLVNGSSADVVFSGLTSNPVSIAVVWDNGVDDAISSAQADFSLGTVTDGVATATVTATIGNLPYTDATYLTADYSYLVTCDDDSEITFDTLTFSPETGNSFITVASPVNDSTSILPSETLANGQQLEWPDEVVISESNTATIDVLADGQYSIEWSGDAASFTFTLRFWNGTEWFDIATTINTAGEVVSGGGLTRVGLTRIGLTTAGLTSVGL